MIGTEGRYDMSETTRPPIDQPATVRKGEELDVIRLAPYLKESIADLDGELVVLQFPSGHSNLTYLLRFGDRELVLRRPPFGSKPKTGHDMERDTARSARRVPLLPETTALV
jgi:aminoglycoside phosphotransferase (APT) family kinase protein